MILKTNILGSKYKTMLIKCDYCGKTFTRASSQVGKIQQYCGTDCTKKAKYEGSYIFPEKLSKECVYCHKPYNDNFYDKSNYRPLCSKECYSKLMDSLPKSKGNLIYEPENSKNYEWYMQGRLIANYINI